MGNIAHYNNKIFLPSCKDCAEIDGVYSYSGASGVYTIRENAAYDYFFLDY